MHGASMLGSFLRSNVLVRPSVPLLTPVAPFAKEPKDKRSLADSLVTKTRGSSQPPAALGRAAHVIADGTAKSPDGQKLGQSQVLDAVG